MRFIMEVSDEVLAQVILLNDSRIDDVLSSLISYRLGFVVDISKVDE